MDISVEILATSLSISKENLRYKIKTWWTHVDVEENQKLIHLPSLPMIQPFYDMNGGRETTVFVEMWYKNDELFPVGSMRFLGLAKQRVDNQLRSPAWNPTVEVEKRKTHLFIYFIKLIVFLKFSFWKYMTQLKILQGDVFY